jgi:transcriptional regulator with XRE-family HTH domain
MNRTDDDRRWGRLKPLRHGSILRSLREESGLSQKQVCQAIGMSPAQLSDVERGIAPLSLRRANQLSKVIGKPFAEVVRAVLQDRIEDAGFEALQVVIVAPVAEPEPVAVNGHSHDADKLP